MHNHHQAAIILQTAIENQCKNELRKNQPGPRLNIKIPDSKVHGANMGPIWGRQDPGGPHVGLMNFAIWDDLSR